MNVKREYISSLETTSELRHVTWDHTVLPATRPGRPVLD